MLGLFTWLTGSTIGRWLGIILLCGGVLFLAVRYVYSCGRRDERQQNELERSMQKTAALARKLAVAKDIADLSSDQRREQLRRYAAQL